MYNEYYGQYKFSDLLNCIIKKIDNNADEELRFIVSPDVDSHDIEYEYRMYHDQDCCEHVYLQEIIGDLDDLIGSPVLLAEEISSDDEPPLSDYDESYTWTFYKLSTIKGSVTLRWYGSSNGYYSEGVSFEKVS